MLTEQQIRNRELPPSIYTRLRDAGIQATYDIDGPGPGLVSMTFAPGTTDEQIDAAEAICREFGKTLVLPKLARPRERKAIASKAAQIITDAHRATTNVPELRAMVADLAQVVRELMER